ncbi:MAG: hypothetical protein GX415_07125 [Chloroflexi bacterium]|jgi:hypothetical protein|nr:hypothetical protein [Anaerolineaceae bacterium]NLI45159.1 hypothetical protein [Chloroflexota bacterium]HOE35402.1 hypothetical protein [Anaerolineaceae bacterium]HOT25231.1 hypothetical protein [Anaerolineaceae bacterium]HQH57829.1 hypothetical protein [Anaerolineaceae bacterium]
MKPPKYFLFFSLLIFLASCNFPGHTPTPAPTALPTAAATPTATGTTTANDNSLAHYPSKAKFQVFILNPVRTCLAGNDFASGSVCFGEKCGDCQCAWEDFDPPAPMTGIPPERIDDPEYAGYAHRVCLEITLTPEEVQAIEDDMRLVAEKVYEWSEGDLELQMSFTELPVDYTGFVAPDFVFGPFEVDDELLNPYVGVDTDFVYTVNGVFDREQNLNLAFACGGSYGEMSIHGAGYANIQYGPACNSITIGGETVYEPLIHEWYHNLDWALYNINQVPDALEGKNPDWSAWQRGSLPACGSKMTGLTWFPSIDLCEWDPDWIDCNNTQSAGRCVHAGEQDGEISWYEHVIRAHYPGAFRFIGNHCRDGRQDFTETGIDSGWPCP